MGVGSRIRSVLSPQGDMMNLTTKLGEAGLNNGDVLTALVGLAAGTYQGVYNTGESTWSYVKYVLEIGGDLTYELRASSEGVSLAGRPTLWTGSVTELEESCDAPSGDDVAVWITKDTEVICRAPMQDPYGKKMTTFMLDPV